MIKKDSAKLSRQYLENAVEELSNADYSIKSGKASGDVALKGIIAKLLKGSLN